MSSEHSFDENAPREIITVGDQFYVLASTALAEDRSRVLKYGDTFAIFDRYGDIRPVGLGEHGLFHHGTRFLSRYELLLEGRRPLVLNSATGANSAELTTHLTNPDLAAGHEVAAPRGTLHVLRRKVLWSGTCHERLRVLNYGARPVRVRLQLRVAADFADMFELRGASRRRRGTLRGPIASPGRLRFEYRGLDDVERFTEIECADARPWRHADGLEIPLALDPHRAAHLEFRVTCRSGDGPPPADSFDEAHRRSRSRIAAMTVRGCEIRSSNTQFDQWLARSAADLHLMVTDTTHGAYPYAGVPWFSAPFGRDGIITALQLLWVDATVAQGVLRFLAATQADREDARIGAQPGKIIHELREGEMANTGEVPFGRYYGSVDATPLFVLLAGEYLRVTDDVELLRALKPSIDLALHWMERFGDVDGDGFIEYQPHEDGLVNQGWKDSRDGVFHRDGTLAAGPIALCEVQGYAYAACRAAARVYAALGESDAAAAQMARAARLQAHFENAFWDETLGLYALALDGRKQPCCVAASNAGQCLFTSLVAAERAARVIRTLMDERFFSGWGIRTVAKGEARFNPMSYHNGSVWPHDNALIARGFARHGAQSDTLRLMGALFDVACGSPLHRMPELFCGFDRHDDESPIEYPLSCAPQAWAAGSVYMLLEAVLGLVVHGATREVRFRRPALPEFLDWVEIRRLAVKDQRVDVRLERDAGERGVRVSVLRRPEGVQVTTET